MNREKRWSFTTNLTVFIRCVAYNWIINLECIVNSILPRLSMDLNRRLNRSLDPGENTWSTDRWTIPISTVLCLDMNDLSRKWAENRGTLLYVISRIGAHLWFRSDYFFNWMRNKAKRSSCSCLQPFALCSLRNPLRIISGHASCKCDPIRGRLSNLRRGSPSNEEKTHTNRVSYSEGILKLQLDAETPRGFSYRPALN